MVLGKIGGLFDNVRTVTASDSIIAGVYSGDNNYYTKSNNYKEMIVIPIAYNGSIRTKTLYGSGNNSYYAYLKISIFRNGAEVYTVEDSTKSTGGKYTFSKDFSDVKNGDILKLYLKEQIAPNGGNGLTACLYSFKIGGTVQ